MSRKSRIVAVGLPHHVMQKGNYGQDIFFNDDDYLNYLSWIKQYSSKYHLSVLAFCLLKNHVHFVVVPYEENSLAKAFNVAHMRYAQYINQRRKEQGHLWQGRFYSCALDKMYCALAIKYIEKNPLRLGLVQNAWEWKWSSALAHIEDTSSLLELEDISRLTDMSKAVWKQYLMGRDRGHLVGKIKRHTLKGYPLGQEEFILKLEKELGKSLKILPRGRPKKKLEV